MAQRLWRVAEGTAAVVILPMPLGPFATTQGRNGTLEGFTATYGCKRLLYFEGYEDIRTAISREKQLKGWRREKKLNLIRTINPEFKDLAQTWGWKMITVHETMYP